MKMQVILNSLVFIFLTIVFYSCSNAESGTDKKDKIIVANTLFAISQVQELTKSHLWLTMENYRFYVQRPDLENQISKTVTSLIEYSDVLQGHIINESWDCSLIVREIKESYDRLENQFNMTIDSVRVGAKLSIEETEERKIIFKESFGFDDVNIDSCKPNFNQEYLISELLRLNISISKFIYYISTYTGRKPVYERIPIVVPNKPYYTIGETFKADIYVGNFLRAGKTKEIIEINGKDYILKGNKVKFQEIVPNHKGGRDLKILYKSEDVYSGKIKTYRGIDYKYTIK